MEDMFKDSAFFLQSKAELDVSPPEASPAPSKPKFQPKAKPRKSRPPKQPAPAQQSAEPTSPDLLPNIKPKLEPAEIDRLSLTPVVAVKSDHPSVVKQELANEEQQPELVKEEEPELAKEEPESLPGSPSIAHDTVVREIDVFLCPTINADTQLYLLQYPLRPHWRPYDLEERCDGVRVKPKQSKLEFDIVLDTEGENYDHDAAEHLLIKKQTLCSSRTALNTNYAVGLLRGNKLFLNPLSSVVQLRPSMKYLDEADVQKKQAKKSIDDNDDEMVDADDEEEAAHEEKQQLVALKIEVKKQETERQEQLRLRSHAYLRQLDEAEAWIPLEPHGVDSPVTDGIRRIMTSTSENVIPFGMAMQDYINHLVPGRASSNSYEAATQDINENEGLSRSFLDTLPLEQRFEKLLSKGRVHVLQFERLMKLAPAGCTEQEVLSVLQDMAHLVQGCWVAASALRYSGHICILRDYILSLFNKNRVIRHYQLEDLQVPREMVREVLVPLAVQRPAEGGWEFQESTDRSFMKRHIVVVKEQMQRWAENEDKIKDAALHLNINSLGTVSKRLDTPVVHAQDPGAKSGSHKAVSAGKGASTAEGAKGRMKAAEFSGEWTMSEETRAALPGALREIFMKHNVCSLQLLCQSLREMAITKAAAANANPKVVAAAVAAAKGASAPSSELTAAISKVASNIDGIYFLTSLGNPSLDPFRDVVVALLRAKGPTSGLRRLDIIEASKIALKTEVQSTVYQKVMKELCYTKGGAWVLKPGDGRPM